MRARRRHGSVRMALTAIDRARSEMCADGDAWDPRRSRALETLDEVRRDLIAAIDQHGVAYTGKGPRP